MALTQGRACGAFAGRRYGSFAGRESSRDVGVLTQPRSFGAQTGSRYGSFTGKAPSESTSERLTQARAFGAFTGRRYGAFDGRTEQEPPPPAPTPTTDFGGGRIIRLRETSGAGGGDTFRQARGPASAFEGYLRGRRRRPDLAPIVGRARPWRKEEEEAGEAERLELERIRRQEATRLAIEARQAADQQAENERLAAIAAEALRQATAQASQALATGAVREATAGALAEIEQIEAARAAQQKANKRKAVLLAALAATTHGRIVIKVEKA